LFAKNCLEEYRLECQLRRLSKRTVQSYYNSAMLFLNYLEKEFDIREIEEIRPLHVKHYIQYLIGRDLTASHSNRAIICLRLFFEYAVQEEYLGSNPAAKIKYQKEPKVLITTFNDAEVKSLLNAFDYSTYLSARNKLVLAIAFDTGARNSEICGIRCCDIQENTILIHGKGNKERHVPISPYLKKIMFKYERMKEYCFEDRILATDHYLLSRTGRPLTKEAVEHIFTQAKASAKVRDSIRCSPHTARHYYAQTCLKNGLDVYTVSRLLGHESLNITKRYLQSLEDDGIVEMAASASPLSFLR